MSGVDDSMSKQDLLRVYLIEYMKLRITKGSKGLASAVLVCG